MTTLLHCCMCLVLNSQAGPDFASWMIAFRDSKAKKRGAEYKVNSPRQSSIAEGCHLKRLRSNKSGNAPRMRQSSLKQRRGRLSIMPSITKHIIRKSHCFWYWRVQEEEGWVHCQALPSIYWGKSHCTKAEEAQHWYWRGKGICNHLCWQSREAMQQERYSYRTTQQHFSRQGTEPCQGSWTWSRLYYRKYF